VGDRSLGGTNGGVVDEFELGGVLSGEEVLAGGAGGLLFTTIVS
jgi:hypothetical protein